MASEIGSGKITDVIFKHRIHPMEVVDASTKVLEAGEPVVAYKIEDGQLIMRVKYGDGQTPLNTLPYVTGGSYSLSTIVTEDIGQLERGDSLLGLDIESIIDKLVTPYNEVSLDLIQLSIESKEVGVPFSDNLVVTPTVSHSYNLASGNAGVIDSTPKIFDSQGVDPRSPIQVTGNGGSLSTIGDIEITLTIYGKNGESSVKSATLSYLAPVYYKSFTNKTSLVAGDLSGMNKKLAKSASGVYSFEPGRAFIAVCKKATLPNTFVYLDYHNEYSFGGMDMTYQGEITQSNGYIDLTYKVYYTTYEHTKRFKIGI